MVSDRNFSAKKAALATLGIVLPLAASRLSRGAVEGGYRRVFNSDPPKDPSSENVTWKAAVAWSAATGLAGGLAKLCLRRMLSSTPVPTVDHEEIESEIE